MFDGITITGFADELAEGLDEQIEGFKNIGLSYIEIRGVSGKGITEYSLEDVKRMKKQLDENGMKISAIGSPIGKIQITDPFEPHFELFKHTVEIAKIMGTPYIRMFSFYIPEGKEADLFAEEVVKRLECMIKYAEEKDIVLLHENEKGIYGDNAQRRDMLLKKFYGKHFRAVFDFANFVQCSQDTWEAFEMLEQYIEYIHVKDAMKKDRHVVPAGYGDGNVKKILSALKEKQYRGFLSLEPHLSEFTRFSEIENGAYAGKEKLNGREVFDIAYTALKDILISL